MLVGSRMDHREGARQANLGVTEHAKIGSHLVADLACFSAKNGRKIQLPWGLFISVLRYQP